MESLWWLLVTHDLENATYHTTKVVKLYFVPPSPPFGERARLIWRAQVHPLYFVVTVCIVITNGHKSKCWKTCLLILSVFARTAANDLMCFLDKYISSTFPQGRVFEMKIHSFSHLFVSVTSTQYSFHRRKFFFSPVTWSVVLTAFRNPCPRVTFTQRQLPTARWIQI